MTVIAVKRIEDSILMACDSQASSGNNHIVPEASKSERSKIFEVNGFCFGSSGLSFETVFFGIFARNHKPAEANVNGVIDFLMEFQEWGKKKDNDFKSENHYLIVLDGKIFQTWGGIITEECDQYAAIGSGYQYAITAMHLGKSPIEAVQVAIDLTPWCCGPINSVTLPGHKVRS